MSFAARRFLFFLFAVGLFGAAPRPAAAQAADTVAVADTLREIRLADGSVIYGRIVAAEKDSVTIRTAGEATLQVPRAQIVSARPVRGRIVAGEVWSPDPNPSRLFFAPTGRPVPGGSGYFGVYELFFPFVTFGVSDAISVTGGTPIIPGLIGEFGYLGGKAAFVNRPKVQAAAGLFGGFLTEEFNGVGGLAFGVATFGDADDAVTAGAGFPFELGSDDDFLGGTPLLMLGGEARLGRRTKFITENYAIPGKSAVIVSGGIRFFGDRLSADAGLVGALGEDGGCCLPLVNFVYTFGGER
ncbi:hypothetical protein BH23GEM4_BH23GEM4_09980 [soil metagenome]